MRSSRDSAARGILKRVVLKKIFQVVTETGLKAVQRGQPLKQRRQQKH